MLHRLPFSKYTYCVANRTIADYINILDRRFGRLVVAQLVDAGTTHGRPNSQSKWLCRCDCGGQRVVKAHHLFRGEALSCGCAKREASARMWAERKANPSAHIGESTSAPQFRTPEYRAWINMNQRCYNLQHAEYKHYGGRGIFVCGHWRRNFYQFLADVGPRPSPDRSIDRRDNNLGYLCLRCHPPIGNCRWATPLEQTRNRRCAKTSPANP